TKPPSASSKAPPAKWASRSSIKVTHQSCERIQSRQDRHSMPILFFRIAAGLCFLGVALGAFGAHWLKPTLEANGLIDAWNKAVLYHFIHAIALFALALFGTANRGAWWLLFAGIIVFSGSLYVMALTNARWLGAITPSGGL